MEELDEFFGSLFKKYRFIFLIFEMALYSVLEEVNNALIFLSFCVYNINHSIFKTMINYISLLLTFISVEFVTSHLPKVFIFLFCLLSSRYLFLLAYLLVFPLILEQIYISNVSTDMYSRWYFKK